MTTQRWAEVEQLFEQLTALSPAERATFIETVDSELRSELESLLRAHASVDGPLDVPPAFSGDPTAAAGARETRAGASLDAGARVGPYALLAPIAEGGMGSVWLAERADGFMKRKVALKLPHWSWVRPELAERLAREREILAGLEHPNIARLYDAGVDSLGRPYLAMEYVEGRPIDVYCDQERLGSRARLALVVQVARAVTHAHGRLVVHRDLKPSNILVAADGSVRLLDFGIAKLLETDTAHETRLTQLSGRAMTPEYASPEQIKGEPIGTSTDVYSLAVVAYRLLTGTPPYRLKRRSAAELEEAIVSADPLPASDAVADRAGKRALRGDLDAILNKALKKDPAQRYASVEAFAQDIERYLRGETVTARPDSSLYRLGKFASRHRLGLGAASAMVIALLGATAISLWQARVAERQRSRAVELLERNEAVTEFVNVMLTEVASPTQPITLDDLLTRSESMINESVTRNPEHQAAILQVLASYYINLGQPRRADELLNKALGLIASTHDATLRTRITCMRAFAQSQLDSAEHAKATLEHIVADTGTSAEAAARCLQYRAYIAQNSNDPQNALTYTLRARSKLAESERFDPVFEASLIGDLAYAYDLGGQTSDADRTYAESIRKFVAIGRPEHPESVTIRNNWGIAVYTAGNVQRALAIYDEALRIALKHAAGGTAPMYLITNRALALTDLARFDEAAAEYDRVIAAGRKDNNGQLRAAGSIGRLRVCIEQAQFDCAEQWLQAAQQEIGNAPPDGAIGMQFALARARIAAGRGRFDEARAGFTRLVEFWDSRHMEGGPLASALRGRAELAMRQGADEAALADMERALKVCRKLQSDGPYSKSTGLALSLLSRIHARMGRKQEAHDEAVESARQLEQALGPQHPETLRARELAKL